MKTKTYSPIVFCASVRNGAAAISKETVAVRGIAKNGPIVRYRRELNSTPYTGWTREASSLRPAPE